MWIISTVMSLEGLGAINHMIKNLSTDYYVEISLREQIMSYYNENNISVIKIEVTVLDWNIRTIFHDYES